MRAVRADRRPLALSRQVREWLTTGIAVLLVGLVLAQGARNPQVEAGHMRWNNVDAVLSHSVAWQEEQDGRWVTVVVLSDKQVDPSLVEPGKPAPEVMREANVQGIAFSVMSGGVPPPSPAFMVGFRDNGEFAHATMSGVGGFEIQELSALIIKGRTMANAVTFGSRDENAWLVDFDVSIIRGNLKRMTAEGEALGPGGGAPGADLIAAEQAKLAMDLKALSQYASDDLLAFVKGSKELQLLKGMTAPQRRILGGLRTGETARIHWVQQRPNALEMRCVDTMVLKGGRWRSTESVCQSE